MTLVYGQRTAPELYYHDDFLALADKYPNFTYVPALSDEPADSDWSGYRGYRARRGRGPLRQRLPRSQGLSVRPPLMIDACITALMQGRLFERDIYMEKFFSAADVQQVRSPLFKKI